MAQNRMQVSDIYGDKSVNFNKSQVSHSSKKREVNEI